MSLCGFFILIGIEMKFAAYFSIIVGLAMIGQWTASFLSKQIPELKTEPIRIWFHIFGELLTALMLIAGGFGLLLQAGWGAVIFLLAMGMLFYTAIVSPGYFAQQGKWPWVIFFAVLIILGIIAVFQVLPIVAA